jgi:hypothetical protein
VRPLEAHSLALGANQMSPSNRIAAMGLQHCCRSYDPATRFKHMRFKHMRLKHMRLKQKTAATHHASLPQSF